MAVLLRRSVARRGRLRPRAWTALAFGVLAVWAVAGALRAQDNAPESKEAPDNPQIFGDEGELASPLDPGLLRFVTDSAGLPIVPPVPPPGDKEKNRAFTILSNEYMAYCEAVAKASKSSAKAFANSARPDLTYAHLWTEPAKYRGQVVHVEGRLKRVRRFDAPAEAARAGVPDIYEGWLFTEAAGANPVCIVFTDLPEGLPVAEDMRSQVTFDGYFFKKYRYKAADSRPGQAREAPLLIGHAPLLQQAAVSSAAPASAWTGTGPLVVILATLVIGTLVLAFGLHWWFHRSDNRVRHRVEQARASLVEPSPAVFPSRVGSETPPPGFAEQGGGQNGGTDGHGPEAPTPFRWRDDPGAG